ncbi:MAG: (2Fe-2S)-binding protein [Deltaproteobacteria bacterium]|jgi:NADH-quinone oxidoreductase subunit G/NADP-reducing hydrogenase subunit HndD|nr:(2Fe-2S)-binding protein [Deltaproteobacteria bacterium]
MREATPNTEKTVNLTIDGIPASVPAGTSILEAARGVGVVIPTLCDREDLPKRAVCRLCVVECDGGGRLKAACATEVWEGVAVATATPELRRVRKSIVEMLLADHPRDCFVCPRNLNCELQRLAFELGAREFPSYGKELPPAPAVEAGTIARDPAKCVKCARCVAVCREGQKTGALSASFRSASFQVGPPYGDALQDGACVFCGRCASVCPVGAITASDRTDALEAALDRTDAVPSAVFADEVLSGVEASRALPPGSLTPLKLSTFLKLRGFRKVYPRALFSAAAAIFKAETLVKRLKDGSALPFISFCSESSRRFLEIHFPDLLFLVGPSGDPGRLFSLSAKKLLPDGEKILAASFSPSLSKKRDALKDEGGPLDFALSVGELTNLVARSGADLGKLAESPYDPFPLSAPSGAEKDPILLEAAGAIRLLDARGESGRILEEGGKLGERVPLEAAIGGRKTNMLLVFGLGAAHDLFTEFRGKPLPWSYLRVVNCPGGCVEGGGQDPTLVGKRLARGRNVLKTPDPRLAIPPLPHEAAAWDLFRAFKERGGVFSS